MNIINTRLVIYLKRKEKIQKRRKKRKEKKRKEREN